MADYRLDCCGGFPGHQNGCPVPEQAARIERRQKAEKHRQEMAWREFFDNMTDEEVFEYLTKTEDEIARVDKWQKRHRAAMEYIRYQKLYRGDTNYFDRLRAWQKEHYDKH